MNIDQLILGGEQFGLTDWGDITFYELSKVFESAITKGFIEIDTSNIYGLGMSEKNIRVLKKQYTSDIEVSTKVGLHYTLENENSRAKIYNDCSEKSIFKSVENSLKRLGLNSLHTVYIHYPDPKVSIKDSIKSLAKLKKDGIAKHIGLCNYDLGVLTDSIDLELIDRYQTEINLINYLLNPKFYDELIATLKSEKIEIVAYSPLKRGLITNDIFENIQKIQLNKHDRRSRLSFFKSNSKELVLLKNVIKFCHKEGVELSDIAINFILDFLIVEKVILGFSKENQVKKIGTETKCNLDFYKKMIKYVQ
jgi:aryl-alcohol dehydrogenase-like predicted oxidoreductase